MLIKIRNKCIEFFGHLKFAWSIGFIASVQYKPKGYKVKGFATKDIMQLIKPGDVLLRGYDNFISSKMIGYWSHSGLVLDSNKIIHAIGKGVVIESTIDFCRTDRIVILRPNIEKNKIEKILKIAKSFKGKSYDFSFDFGDPTEFSCTELVFECFKNHKEQLGMKKKVFSILGIFKKNVIEPKDFLEFNGFEEVKRYES